MFLWTILPLDPKMTTKAQPFVPILPRPDLSDPVGAHPPTLRVRQRVGLWDLFTRLYNGQTD
jgi:hypothetical protein